jgi:hypothetical protein
MGMEPSVRPGVSGGVRSVEGIRAGEGGVRSVGEGTGTVGGRGVGEGVGAGTSSPLPTPAPTTPSVPPLPVAQPSPYHRAPVKATPVHSQGALTEGLYGQPSPFIDRMGAHTGEMGPNPAPPGPLRRLIDRVGNVGHDYLWGRSEGGPTNFQNLDPTRAVQGCCW